MTGGGLAFKGEPCAYPVKVMYHKHIGDPFLISTHKTATVFPEVPLFISVFFWLHYILMEV